MQEGQAGTKQRIEASWVLFEARKQEWFLRQVSYRDLTKHINIEALVRVH
jgi:hypothetical protein